jgi:hypothetical protein
MRSFGAKLVIGVLALGLALPARAADRPHNIVLFVPDGLRALIVTGETAPTMAAIRDQGVNFRNPHSLFPTFTMPNGSALATGHYFGDTGTFSNTIYVGFPVPGAGGSVTPFLESDPVLGDVDEHFSGDYLDETTILKAARAAGISTAAIGKLGPTLIFDHGDRTGAPTIVVDDATGGKAGIPLSPEVQEALRRRGFRLPRPAAAPTAMPAMPPSPARQSPMSCSRVISPMSRRRRCCRCSRRAISLSF